VARNASTAGWISAISTLRCPFSFLPETAAIAALVAKHHDERNVQVLDGVLDAGEGHVVGHVAGVAHQEEISQPLAKHQLGRDPRIGAAHDHGNSTASSTIRAAVDELRAASLSGIQVFLRPL